jgi:hypothetical protein
LFSCGDISGSASGTGNKSVPTTATGRGPDRPKAIIKLPDPKTGAPSGALFCARILVFVRRMVKALFRAYLGPVARSENEKPTRQVKPWLPADAYACLEFLATLGRYGSNPTEVARYLLLREIDDLTRSNVLPKDPITSTQD